MGGGRFTLPVNLFVCIFFYLFIIYRDASSVNLSGKVNSRKFYRGCFHPENLFYHFKNLVTLHFKWFDMDNNFRLICIGVF